MRGARYNGNLVTKQLAKFVTLSRHQLAGQLANLEFWTSEVRHALAIIDGYEKRFEGLKRAQTKYVAEHQTGQFGPNDSDSSIDLPTIAKGIRKVELEKVRAELCHAARQFLLRGYHEGLLDAEESRKACAEAAIGFDPSDSLSGKAKRAR